jgi:hypothetical protein
MGVKLQKAPYLAVSFWRVRDISQSLKNHGDFCHLRAKLAVKTGFLGEIHETHFNFSEWSVFTEYI